MIERLVEAIRASRRRLPRVEVVTGPTLPGWALRITAALLPLLLTLAALVRTPMWSDPERETAIIGVMGNLTMAPSRSATFVGIVLIAAVALTLSTLRWPSAWQPLLTVLGVVLMVVLTPGGRWWTLPFAALGYLGYRLCVLAEAVPWNARLEWAVLRHAAPTDALVLGVTLVIGAIGLVLDGDLTAGLVIGAILLLGLAWWLRRPRFDAQAARQHDARIAAKRAARGTIQIEAGREAQGRPRR